MLAFAVVATLVPTLVVTVVSSRQKPAVDLATSPGCWWPALRRRGRDRPPVLAGRYHGHDESRHERRHHRERQHLIPDAVEVELS